MLKSLVILGAGGFAREVLDVVDAINAVSPTWEMLGFIVDHRYGTPGDLVHDKPILGDFSWLEQHQEVQLLCAVGAPEIRYRMIRRLAYHQWQFASLVHPSVIRTRWMSIGQGVVITAGCVISNNVVIADHVHINPSSTIGHDVHLESFVSVAPGVRVSGNVSLREGAYIGTGANIIEKKTIGAWSIVGAGGPISTEMRQAYLASQGTPDI
ncbi:MAG: acetyltransferase [Anaerolineae bacterium]